MSALPPPEFWNDVDRPVLEALSTLLGLVDVRALDRPPSVEISISVDSEYASMTLSVPIVAPDQDSRCEPCHGDDGEPEGTCRRDLLSDRAAAITELPARILTTSSTEEDACDGRE
jgi:hypothetical protein